MKTVAVKIVILGSQGVGKTSLVTRYETKSFQKNTSSTIGASFSNVEAIIDDVKVKMQVWDTAGQERFRSMAPMYYRGANAALLAWAHELTHRVEGELMLVVVGNKMDLAEQRVVPAATARNYADSIGAPFFETSALDNTGVQEMFQEVAASMVQQAETNTNPNLRVYSNEQGKNRRGSILQLGEDGGERARGGGCC
ncbi:hypothetical protein O3P69_018081 [Scylla paramamosain]|uniref:Uncharacterized protein n=1 Tax=Scylla paramamosain TaxID=85552 RepID=A0AAW0THJ2_SCYPA